MGKRKKSRPFLGRAMDIGKPGLDRLEEVRAIVWSIMEDYKKGRADAKTTRRRLGTLKRLVNKSDLSEFAKADAITLIAEAQKRVKEMERQRGGERYG